MLWLSVLMVKEYTVYIFEKNIHNDREQAGTKIEGKYIPAGI